MSESVEQPEICREIDLLWEKKGNSQVGSFIKFEPFGLAYKYDTATSREVRQILKKALDIIKTDKEDAFIESYALVRSAVPLLEQIQKEAQEWGDD